MKNDKDKISIITPENMAEFSLRVNPAFTTYKVNVNNVKTIKDIRLIFKHLNLHYTPNSMEDYEEIKHLLIIN